ncbi:cyclic nucleotide-gated cation channel alpha-3-like, partial [Sycon ciliatum]|uniref:cyclic nucleotide-gated cation channel alpha-3-like n=1 Tax=Sycon ciliatum TaxID=27933 RepID=UPI0031F646CB
IFAGGKFIRTLCEGSTFGEIALLGLGNEGDVKLPGGKIVCKRTADAQSVGYSEVFILGKRDLMGALSEYPEARLALETQAMEW